MKTTLSKLKMLIKEYFEKRPKNYRNIKIWVEDDKKIIVDPIYGHMLEADALQWDYKKFYKFLKNWEVDFIEIETLYLKKRDNWIKDGHYTAKEFLKKLAKLENVPKKVNGKIVPTVKGENPKFRTINTLSTQRHIPHEIE